MKNWPKGGVALVTWPTFQILGPLNISGTAEDTNLKFCMRIDHKGWDTIPKIGPIGPISIPLASLGLAAPCEYAIIAMSACNQHNLYFFIARHWSLRHSLRKIEMDTVTTERFLSLIQSHPILYDLSSRGYHDKDRKKQRVDNDCSGI